MRGQINSVKYIYHAFLNNIRLNENLFANAHVNTIHMMGIEKSTSWHKEMQYFYIYFSII